MPRASASTAAFDELIAALVEIRDGYVLSPTRAADELEVLEAFHYVTQLLSEASELLVEADAERPRFSSIVSPARKFLGDNPDALYQQAIIRGDRSYRITGRRDTQSYVSFTIHGHDPAGGINGPVLADINDRDLTMAADGTFELILSAEQHPGNWVRLDPQAHMVIVRNYYLRRLSAQNDPQIVVQLHIEPLDDPGPPPVLDDATTATRLRDATAFLRASTLGMRDWDAPSTVPFASRQTNAVGKPFSFRQTGVDAAGAVDIFYSSGRFDLAPDEALIMEGSLPSCVFANVMLWNVHMQTLDYRYRSCSLNGAQIQTGSGGSYRIVIAGRDPGVANWLDTAGHRRGTIFWRFLLPSEDPVTPRCRVVGVGEVAQEIATGRTDAHGGK